MRARGRRSSRASISLTSPSPTTTADIRSRAGARSRSAVWWTILVGIALGVWPPRVAARRGRRGAARRAGGWELASTRGLRAPRTRSRSSTARRSTSASTSLSSSPLRPDRLGTGSTGCRRVVAHRGRTERPLPRLVPGAWASRDLPDAASTRLSFPVGYWNGLGILTGIAVPLLVHSALAGGRARRMLSIGVVPALGAVLYLTSSRGAVAATGAGTIVVVAQGTQAAARGSRERPRPAIGAPPRRPAPLQHARTPSATGP